MKKMNKSKFIENIWITFNYNSMFCVGRTKISDGIEMVASVNERGLLEHVLYEKIDNVKQLKILKDVKFKDYNSENRDIDFATNTN